MAKRNFHTLRRNFHTLRERILVANDTADQYKQELYLIINYAAQMKAYQLPILHDSSTWPGGNDAYQQANLTWADMTGKLQAWALSTLKNVTELPATLLQNSSQVVVPTLNGAISICQLLIQDPGNITAKNSLMTDLHLLSINFTQFSAMTQPLIDSLEGQATVFDQDAQTMQTIADQALQTVGTDQKKINDLNKMISDLQNDIKSRSAAIAGGVFVTIAGIVIGVVAIVLAPATGGVSLALLVPAGLIIAGGVAIIALNAIAIQNDKTAIDQLNTQITNYGADILLLQSMASTLNGFASQVDTLKNALGAIVQPWQSAEDYFISTINTLSSIENATSSDWQQINNELQDILVNWNSLMNNVSQLQMSAQVSSAKLTVGMSENDVQQALNAAPKVDLIQYLTTV